MHVCAHTHTACVHTCIHTLKHTHLHTHTDTRVHTCIHTHKHTPMCTHTHTHTHTQEKGRESERKRERESEKYRKDSTEWVWKRPKGGTMSKNCQLTWWASRSTIIARATPSTCSKRKRKESVMSAYAQNPPPLSLLQWWKPPPTLIAHPLSRASFPACTTGRTGLRCTTEYGGRTGYEATVCVVFFAGTRVCLLQAKLSWLSFFSALCKLFYWETPFYFSMGGTRLKSESSKVRNHTHNASQHHFYCFLKDIWMLKSGCSLKKKQPPTHASVCNLPNYSVTACINTNYLNHAQNQV